MTPLNLASLLAGARIYMALSPVDMRKGFDGLAMVVQDVLKKDPFRGNLFIFRGTRADLVKILMWDATGLCLFAKRLERGRFVWAVTQEGEVMLTPAQLSMLLEGIDRRQPLRTDQPRRAG
jgi:transposase